MGNRSYLLDKEAHILFEANNSLPLFWLGLLNRDMLRRFRVSWDEYERQHEVLNDETKSTEERPSFWNEVGDKLDFVITQEKFLANSQKLVIFSRQHLGEIDGLTTDFIQFLSKQLPAETDYLRISALEFAGFYDSSAAFFDYLTAQVEMITENPKSVPNLAGVLADPLGEGTGFVSGEGSDFSVFSANYRSYGESEMPSLAATNKHAKSFFIIVSVLLVLIALWLFLMFRRSLSITEPRSELNSSLTNENEPNTQFEAGEQRVEIELPLVFNIMSQGDISDANGNSWLVMESDELPGLLLELSVKNKATSQSPQSVSFSELDLVVTEKEKVDYHGFSRERLLTLSQEKGFVYEFETEALKGEILFVSDEGLGDEEQLLFEQMIDSLVITQATEN